VIVLLMFFVLLVWQYQGVPFLVVVGLFVARDIVIMMI